MVIKSVAAAGQATKSEHAALQPVAAKEELEKSPTSDSLTGLYDRQAILGKLRELISFGARYKEDFSLSLLDIDHFKAIDDRHGHVVGDEVLARIAALIPRNIRDTDVVGRYGGDEFLIIFPKTNLSLSWVAAERLRSTIEKTAFTDSAGKAFTLTVSQGVAAWERTDDVSSLVSRAAEALGKARDKGRNRVQILLGPSLRDKI